MKKENETDEMEQMEGQRKPGGQRAKRFSLAGSLVVKTTAFILLFVSIAVGLICGVGCFLAVEEGVYFDGGAGLIKDSVSNSASKIAHEVRERLKNGYEDTVAAYLSNVNAQVAILNEEDVWAMDSSVFLWQSYDSKDAHSETGFFSDLYHDCGIYLPYSFFENRERGENADGQNEEDDRAKVYIFRVFIDTDLTKEDDIKVAIGLATLFCRLRFVMIGVLAGSILMAVICFVFLLYSAGRRNNREGIVPGPLTWMHFDVVTALTVGLLSVMAAVFVEATYYGDAAEVIAGGAILLAAGMLLMLWLMDFAIRLKLGKWWRHTLIYIILRAVWRGLTFLAKGLFSLLKELPVVMTTVIVYLGICILEMFGLALFDVETEGVFLWGIEKIVLFVVILYTAVVCRRLLNASRKLAEGREDYRVDTRYFIGAFREHGENLNSLGQGISKAVAERMRSEHLKTELITNVSHDLKTPLTSIINYANLICEEETENLKIAEYSEVLLRQSGRLKKLLEDLVEASKATTGNVEVNLAPCEVGVLLTQAVGEYQQRMEEKGLELKDRQPEQPVKILADGRHLWRVFDNLLNNICKYAQENSRVYLSLEQQEDKVFVIFRNMSQYALDISPEELEERFVRGDKSRHMEGNGLGLSIAKSLTQLQNGKLDIVIDGDLFKVTLTFQALKE